MGEEPIDVHRELFELARTYGSALDEVAERVFRIDSVTPENLPEEAEALYRGIAKFLATYQPPRLGEKWLSMVRDDEGPSGP